MAMELTTLTLDREQATIKWQECIAAEKHTKARQIQDMKKVYYALKKGHKILDLYETLKKLPLNADGDPMIAVAPITASRAQFLKMAGGAGKYGASGVTSWRHGKGDILIPAGTFKKWAMTTETYPTIDRVRLTTLVPTVPPKYAHLVTEDRYILFEVEKWELQPPHDPLILKRVTPNLFAIEAKFNLTKLERAIARGNI